MIKVVVALPMWYVVVRVRLLHDAAASFACVCAERVCACLRARDAVQCTAVFFEIQSLMPP